MIYLALSQTDLALNLITYNRRGNIPMSGCIFDMRCCGLCITFFHLANSSHYYID